jgi:hypothetical protein
VRTNVNEARTLSTFFGGGRSGVAFLSLTGFASSEFGWVGFYPAASIMPIANELLLNQSRDICLNLRAWQTPCIFPRETEWSQSDLIAEQESNRLSQ